MTTGSGSTRKAQPLTAKAIEALKPDADDAYRQPDMHCKGLALRVALDGGKTWKLGARVGEVCGLTVDELKQDVSGRLLWTLPAARSKNGRARVTPIVG